MHCQVLFLTQSSFLSENSSLALAEICVNSYNQRQYWRPYEISG